MIRQLIEFIGLSIDVAGVVIIAGGTLFLLIKALIADIFPKKDKAILRFQEYRKNLGRIILIGLEFLVAGDLIRTVAIEPTFTSVGVLAGIVAIRTFLSFSLDIEMTGRLPWAKNEGDNRQSD